MHKSTSLEGTTQTGRPPDVAKGKQEVQTNEVTCAHCQQERVRDENQVLRVPGPELCLIQHTPPSEAKA